MGVGQGTLEDVVMFGGVFEGRRVLVTGHTGFKGSWLTLWLLDLGAHVTGYALDPPTEPSLFAAIGLPSLGGDRLDDRRGDVRKREALRRVLFEARPDVVFHLAAQPMVRRSYAEPHLTYETNVVGTLNLLEAVRELATAGRGPRVVLNVTTDKCYENLETARAYVESDALGGFDPYSSSKACSELVTAAYRRSYFTAPDSPRVASARAGNVVGGGDFGEDRLLPDCVRALLDGRSVMLRNPGAVRPWQHVLEPLSGYLAVTAALWDRPAAVDTTASAGAWNFGPGAGCLVSVRELVETALHAWGSGAWRRAPGAAEDPHEAGLLVLDAGKAERELGWRPVWEAEQAVTTTMDWYAAWSAGADKDTLAALCREQVAAYAAAAGAAGVAWATEPVGATAPPGGER